MTDPQFAFLIFVGMVGALTVWLATFAPAPPRAAPCDSSALWTVHLSEKEFAQACGNVASTKAGIPDGTYSVRVTRLSRGAAVEFFPPIPE